MRHVGVFGGLEVIDGGIAAVGALVDYFRGSLGEGSLDFEADKRIVELLTGRRY